MSDECGNGFARRFSLLSMRAWPTSKTERKMCCFWRLTYTPERIEKNVLENRWQLRHVPEMIRTYAPFVTAS